MKQNINFTDKEIEDAKSRACGYSSPYMTTSQLEQAIADAENALKEPALKSDHDFWSRRLKELKQTASDPKFKQGKHPQSIDTLVVEIIEIRSFLHALINANVEGKPFDSYFIFNHLRVSMVYALVSKFGKLVSKQDNDVSLRKYWSKFSKYLVTTYPIEAIESTSEELKRRFTKKNSETVYFRNKVIAHNEQNIGLSLEAFDKDFEFIITVWSDLTCWSSLGLPIPWSDEKYVFDGIEHFCSKVELKKMKDLRKQYINQVIEWSKITITGKQTNKSPFGLPFVNVTVKTTC